jgi:DNA-binding beta-propeller fold protein YncE
MRYVPATAVALLMIIAGPAAQQRPTVPEIPFESVPNFLKMPPDLYLGEVAGVALNSKKHLYVYSRTGSPGPVMGNRAAQLFEFGPDGKFIREIGKHLYGQAWAHSVKVDKDDNIWTVDEAAHTVVKFDPQGRVLMVLGRHAETVEGWPPGVPAKPGVVPPARDGYFNRPTDVAFDADGNIYVSDGYANARVAKYNKDGEWVKSWGEHGSAPGQFNLVHSIAVDAKGLVYVADRGNDRIQVFDSNGGFIRQFGLEVLPPQPPGFRATIPHFGVLPDGTYERNYPGLVCISSGQYLYTRDAMPGRLYKMTLEGKVLGTIGIAGPKLGQFGWIHGLDCSSDSELYVGELLTWRVQKLRVRTSESATR